jgi:hypothetical protein
MDSLELMRYQLKKINSLLRCCPPERVRGLTRCKDALEKSIRDVSLEKWKEDVYKRYPEAKLTLETGKGETYGDVGDVVAHTGPDMQADAVATWNHEQQHGMLF